MFRVALVLLGSFCNAVIFYSQHLAFLGSLWGRECLSTSSWNAYAWVTCSIRTAYTRLPYTARGDFAAQLLTPELTDNLHTTRRPSRASPDRAAYVRAHAQLMRSQTVLLHPTTKLRHSKHRCLAIAGVTPVAGIGERRMWGDEKGLPLQKFACCHLSPDSVCDRGFSSMLL
jgi:hypothetical protein